jgi:hypothetical protein
MVARENIIAGTQSQIGSNHSKVFASYGYDTPEKLSEFFDMSSITLKFLMIKVAREFGEISMEALDYLEELCFYLKSQR